MANVRGSDGRVVGWLRLRCANLRAIRSSSGGAWRIIIKVPLYAARSILRPEFQYAEYGSFSGRYTVSMQDLTSRITVNPEQCGGRPCVRGMRVRVCDVLDLFAAGLAAQEILQELPYLEPEDLQACLQYAAREVGHPVLVSR
jgi:uncharacterized protein (DUF433 family)